MQNLESLIDAKIDAALTVNGFVKKKKGYVYPISDKVSGVLYPVISTLYTTPRTYKVNATIGVRHDEVEALVVKEKSDETFSVFLSYTCPNNSYREWTVESEKNLSDLDDFLNCIVVYGIPFIKTSLSLERIKEILESGDIKKYPETLAAVKQLLLKG